MENRVTAICQECKKQFEYELKPGYPRKYCIECSAIKKASYENKQTPVNTPVVPQKAEAPGVKSTDISKSVYTSYAKDIFCALVSNGEGSNNLQEDMRVSIELVKQARDSF